MDIALEGVSSYADYTESQLYEGTGGQELDESSFLNLLVTQLQYQDPLEPQSNEEFVAQLAQFSSLEAMNASNESLENLYMVISSMNNASMTQLLGQEVVAASDSFSYEGEGDVDLSFEAESACEDSTITITDSTGTVVWSEDIGELTEGDGTYTWDGTTIDGTTAEEGEYSFSVSGTDVDGESVEITGVLKGIVNGMNYETGTPIPLIDGVEIELGDILEVRAISSDEDSTDNDNTSEETG